MREFVERVKGIVAFLVLLIFKRELLVP